MANELTMTEVLIVGLGGFFGAISRFYLSEKLNRNKGWSLGTLSVNLVGSLIVGVIFGLALPKVWMLFLVSGFAGALTTFSTMQKEIIERWQAGMRRQAVSYVIVTYGGGLLLALIGYLISVSHTII